MKRNLDDVMGEALARECINVPKEDRVQDEPMLYLDDRGFKREITALAQHMRALAAEMKFEEAAALQERILRVRRERLTEVFGTVPATGPV